MTEAKPDPLAGLKVLDLSRVLAGPFAGRMLRDLGADVVKVEPPEGDVTRFWGKVIGGVPGYYNQQNAGKRNVCIDLRASGGAALVIALAEQADILIENFRPDVMPRLGLGWPVLRAANPRLIMLSISGFGQGGPESRRPAYAPIVHAELGLIERGARKHAGRPRDLPLSVADTNASLHGLVATLAAVILREKTGVGQHIDLAMMDATLVSDDQLHADLDGVEPEATNPDNIWSTGAGPVLLSADPRHLWRRMSEVFGVTDGAPDGVALEEKVRLRRRAMAQFLQALESWPSVAEAMAKMNIAWGEVRDARTLRDQPTVRHRRSIAEIDDRAGGARPIPQSPYRFSAARSEVRGGAPHRGEHNAEVLADWLGRGGAAVAELEGAGVLLKAEPATAP